MRWLLVGVLLAGCEKKPEAPLPPQQSLFQTDRVKACTGFAKRAAPSMRTREPIDQRIAADCETAGRVSASNYDCLMATKTADDVGACFAGFDAGGPSETFGRDKPAACVAYAQHVIALMTEDLERTMYEACTSSGMKEQQYDCVMRAKSDAEFKHCLGLQP